MKKIKTFAQVKKIADVARRQGKTIVATNGCFDLLHVGHIRNLTAGKKLGDLLIVGLNSDSSVRKYKGAHRPILSERDRAEMLAALECVDYVFLFSESKPFVWMRKLKPHIHIKGGKEDPKHPDYVEQRRVAESYGGRLKFVANAKGKSTSTIISRIKSLEE